MQTASTFQTAFRALINAEIRSLKRSGVVSMGADNLWQIVAVQASRLPNAPRGTNCAYYARQDFDAITTGIGFVTS